MKRLSKLKSQRAAVKESLLKIVKAVDSEDRGFTDSEKEAISAKETELTELDSEISILSKATEWERSDAKVVDEAEDYTQTAVSVDSERPKKLFNSLGDQLTAVIAAGAQSGNIDPRLHMLGAASGANERIPSEGGFLVEHETAEGLLSSTYSQGMISSRVRRLPIGANKNGVRFNVVKESSRQNGSRHGGIQVYWANEAELYTDSKAKLRRVDLELNKLIGLTYLTDELMEDSVALEAYVRETFPKEFQFKIEDAILNGTGTGQMLGALKGGAAIQVPIESGQTIANSSEHLAKNTAKMLSRLPEGSLTSAVWLINSDLLPYLLTMTMGTGGSTQPIYLPPSGNIADAPLGYLWGRPVIPVEQSAALGTPGDIMLVNLSDYVTIDKGGIKQQSSIHVRFLYGETALRWEYRVDGQPLTHAPVTPFNGGNSKSPYILLAARS